MKILMKIKGNNNIKNSSKGITLVALVLTIIILLILAGVGIATLTEENGILGKASEAKIMQAIGAIKEEIKLAGYSDIIDNKNSTVEQLLADGKVQRTVQPTDDVYYMHYIIKSSAYQSMSGLGEGTKSTLKDVFLIDDNFNVKYIDKTGKEYGDNIQEKILEDETEIRFASKAFSEYVSKISGITEENMKFKWMKNQTKLVIANTEITSLEDLVFFPNLTTLAIGEYGNAIPQITTLDGIENCQKLSSLEIIYGQNKDYSALKYLSTLKTFYRFSGNDFDNIIEALKNSTTLENFTIRAQNIIDMSKVAELKNLKILNLGDNKINEIQGLENQYNLTHLTLANNAIIKIEGLESLSNLQVLNLTNNKITDITPISLNSALTQLYLTKNSEIDGNRNNYSQEGINALNEIGKILDRNGLIYIDVDKLKLFTNYTRLDLSSQNLTTLDSIEGLDKLKYLNLNGNRITLEDKKSQEILKSMANLEELNLNGNNIINITSINYLKELKTLVLTGNQNIINLKEIEDIICNLSTLRVSTENLRTITNCDINKITKLNLNYSGLTEIPDLSKFTNLISINFTGNSSILDFNEVNKIKSLKSLYLSNVNLHEKTFNFSNLLNLKYFNLSNNTLWSEDLEKLKELKNNKNLTIDLSNNSIIDASSLLVLDTSCIINLQNNVNLTQESKDALRSRFGSNVSF